MTNWRTTKFSRKLCFMNLIFLSFPSFLFGWLFLFICVFRFLYFFRHPLQPVFFSFYPFLPGASLLKYIQLTVFPIIPSRLLLEIKLNLSFECLDVTEPITGRSACYRVTCGGNWAYCPLQATQ